MEQALSPEFLPRDFIETVDKLYFAVVAEGTEECRALCFLRYLGRSSGLQKLSTEEANALLREAFPHYLYYSRARDARLHGVPVEEIVRHYRPRQRLQELLTSVPKDLHEESVVTLAHHFIERGIDLSALGVTGSLLVGAHNPRSDIDWVFYERQCFTQAQAILRELMESRVVAPLNPPQWRDAYARRGCHLSFEEYLWHEQRKYNKGMINGIKFDLGLVVPGAEPETGAYSKIGQTTVRGELKDATYAFDMPARYVIDHSELRQVVCYTPTYCGQALTGDIIEAAGWIERGEDGEKRLVVGSDREALGQYIKVIKPRD